MIDHCLDTSFAHSDMPFDTPILNPVFPSRDGVVSTCMPTDPDGPLAEYALRIKTAPFVEKLNDDGTKRVDDSGTTGTPFIRMHGSTSNSSKDICTNWVQLKTGFKPGKTYEFSLLSPDVGPVTQVDLKNESEDTWTPEVLALKRLTTKSDPWAEFLLGQPLGAKEPQASFLPAKVDKLTVVDKETGLIKLADS